MKWSRKRPCWEQLDYYEKFGLFWDSNLFSVRTVNSHFYYYFLIMALWCRLNVETLSRYFLHVYVSQNRYWERVPTKIKHCAANFQILKIAKTLVISSPYWIIHCCVVHLWNKFLIRQKTTKIDITARHKRILVEKSVILTQPTCPTDKARRHIFVRQPVLQPFQVLSCNSHQDRSSLWHWDRPEKNHSMKMEIYAKLKFA